MKADPFVALDGERRRAPADRGRSASPGLARLLARLPLRRHRLTVHPAAGFAGPGGRLSDHRMILAVRVIGIALLGLSLPIFPVAARPALLAAGLLVAAAASAQAVALRHGLGREVFSAIAMIGLLADASAAYLYGQSLLFDATWLGFAAYPLIAIEAAIVIGPSAAFAVTGLSMAVLLGQAALRAGGAEPLSAPALFVAESLVGLNGLFVGLYARVNQRVRGDLATLLEMAGLLAHQESPNRIVQSVDARLRDLLGARVRSVALRRPDGGYEVIRWRSHETRIIPPDAVALISRSTKRDIERDFRDGRAVTMLLEPGPDEPVIRALGLPAWARAITFVPIRAEHEQPGILPVLWADHRIPGVDELELLHGLADQTGLAFAQAQLHRARQQAATDSLTGLANHRAFRDLLRTLLADAQRRGGRLAILFCDLDRFKTVNDQHGHAVGDQLLHRIAERVRTVARADDVVARYGGDELALILPGASAKAAMEVAERLRREVRAIEAGMGVDVTIGVAIFPEDGTTEDDLIARADAAMYAGKRLGGGRAFLAAAIPLDA